jgi:uncharacterized membrane protein
MPLNLVQHREGPSVWDRPTARDHWDVERWLAAMVAGALFLAGVRRRSTAGWMLTAGAGALAWWAASAIDTRNLRRGQLFAALPHSEHEDAIGEASEESFPASDAPAW